MYIQEKLHVHAVAPSCTWKMFCGASMNTISVAMVYLQVTINRYSAPQNILSAAQNNAMPPPRRGSPLYPHFSPSPFTFRSSGNPLVIEHASRNCLTFCPF